MKSNINRNGLIVWEGPSEIDGEPIVLILSSIQNNSNRKTGTQVETYIIRADMSPKEAVDTGEDYSVCGTCPRRPTNNGSCYVIVWHGPGVIYKQYSEGRYERITDYNILKGKSLRMGSYGDPAAVPIEVWQKLLKHSQFHTGFTEKWREKIGEPFKGICMASCSTVEEYNEAKALGWNCYVSLPLNSPVPKKINKCLNSVNPNLYQCSNCNWCDGAKKDVWIFDHGAKHKIRKYEEEKVSA